MQCTGLTLVTLPLQRGAGETRMWLEVQGANRVGGAMRRDGGVREGRKEEKSSGLSYIGGDCFNAVFNGLPTY